MAVEQLALALTLVSAGVILLLLLGTQILAWYWLFLLAAAGVGIAAYRVRARLASSYAVAQFLDRRLSLHDSLSTAWFLLSRPEGVDQPSARYQLRYAEQVAHGVDPAAAFPLTGKRVWAIAGGVAAVAFGLFALRYLITDNLNLRNALVPVHQLAEVFERVEKALGVPPHRSAPAPDGGDKRIAAVPQNNDQTKIAQQDHPNAEELKTSKAEGVMPPNAMVPTGSPQDNKHPQDAKSENQTGPSAGGERKSSEKGQTPNGQQASSKEGAKSPRESGKDQENASRQATDQQNSVGAMDRLKEAISSLMSKMRPNSGAQKQQQQSSPSSEAQQAAAQAAGDKNQNAEAQKNGSDQQSSEEKSADAQAQGQTTEKAQSAQGHSSDKSADKSNSEAHSGVGRQDGDKTIAEREQLKAMGKLAEIIGKRSADLTGDVMIENPSGKQQLKTGYTQHMGNHADLGGEINRDEIPPADQQYVREYMEEVRKPVKQQSPR